MYLLYFIDMVLLMLHNDVQVCCVPRLVVDVFLIAGSMAEKMHQSTMFLKHNAAKWMSHNGHNVLFLVALLMIERPPHRLILTESGHKNEKEKKAKDQCFSVWKTLINVYQQV